MEETVQAIADMVFHFEGCAAMLIGAFGTLTGFLFGKYFFDRCLIWT